MFCSFQMARDVSFTLVTAADYFAAYRAFEFIIRASNSDNARPSFCPTWIQSSFELCSSSKFTLVKSATIIGAGVRRPAVVIGFFFLAGGQSSGSLLSSSLLLVLILSSHKIHDIRQHQSRHRKERRNRAR